MAGGAGGNLLTAGELRERIVFLSSTRTDDRGFASETYSTVCTVWAAVRPVGGSNENTQDRRAAKLALEISIRYRSDLTDEMRIVWRGKTFEIVAPLQIVPMEGRMTISALEDESLSLAVDHLTVSPSTFFLVSGDTQQLTAVCFDDDGNVLTGIVTWSTSDPAIATVDATTGIVTGVSVGFCTITANCEGKVGTAIADVLVPLTFGLDFAPALRVADIIAPLVYPVGENPTGTPLGVPVWGARNSFRHAYPVGDGTWGQVIPRFPIFAQPSTGGGQNGANETLNFATGPWPASHVSRLQFPAGQFNAETHLIGSTDIQAGDSQDTGDYKRSFLAGIMANAAGSIGRFVHFLLQSRTLFTTLRDIRVAVPSTFQVASYDYASDNERTDSLNFRQLVSDNDGVLMDLQVAGGWGQMPHRTRPRTQELLSPGPWHGAYGMTAQNDTQNCWRPSDVPVGVTASVAPSAIPTPDSADYYSAPVYQQITMFNHASIMTAGQYEKCVQIDGGDLHDVAPNYVWVGFKFKPVSGTPPADGVFQAYVQESTGANQWGPVNMGADDYCPAPMRDADGGRFYWARVPVNTPFTNIVSATVVGGNLVVVTDATHGLSAGMPVCLVGINGVTGGTNPNGIFTVSSVADNTHFTINGVAPTGTLINGTTRLGFKLLKPQIRNEGPDLTFYGTRFAMMAEGLVDQRNTGWHDAWVPRRTITAPQTADPAWPQIVDPSLFMSRTEGFFLMRQMWPFPIGDMLRLGIGKRDFLQGGPAGTGNVFLQGGVLPGLNGPTLINLKFSSAWPSNPALQSWSAQCDITAGTDRFPRFCPFDLALGWKAVNGVTVLTHLGIGMGPGTGITWYQNGDAFFGGTWVIDSAAGAAWDYATFPADKHLGLMSDLDITGMPGGWLQAVAGGSVLPADFRNMVAYQLEQVWGARVDYMA